MTRKYFELIASVLRDLTSEPYCDTATVKATALEFARRLRAENNKFDEARFLKAALPSGSTVTKATAETSLNLLPRSTLRSSGRLSGAYRSGPKK